MKFNTYNFIKKSASFIAIIALIATSVFSAGNIALANPDVTITAGAGATNVSIDTSSLAAGTYTQITGMEINEGAIGDIATGVHTFNLPTGWEFDTASNISVGSNSVLAGMTFLPNVVTPGATSFSITVTTASVNVPAFLNFGNVFIRPTNNAVATSDITHSGVAMAGVTNGNTSFATLTTVAGSADYLIVTGDASMGIASTNELRITAYDQFGNIATGYDGSKSLTFSGPSGAAAVEGTAIAGAVAINFTNGVSDTNVATLTVDTAETATVDVSDGSINSTGDASYDLDLVVSDITLATPTGFSVSVNNSSVLSMNWDSVDGATGYEVYRNTSDSGWDSLSPIGSTGSLSYEDTGLSASTEYFYKIKAVASGVQSPFSNVASAQTNGGGGGSPGGGSSGGGGGGGGGGSSGNISSPVVVTPIETEPVETITGEVAGVKINERTAQYNRILSEAEIIFAADVDLVLEHVGATRDILAEVEMINTTVKEVIGSREVNDATHSSIINFITYGTQSTLKLGSGERAGVVNSYVSAYDKLPTTVMEWKDVIMIANGRFPGETSEMAEAKALDIFKQIYLRDADRSNTNDDAAVTVIAYGLRPDPRNLDSEKVAIRIYRDIFSKDPVSATDWDSVRAIAYSGATR